MGNNSTCAGQDHAANPGPLMNPFSLGPANPQLPSGNIETTAKFFVDRLGFEVAAKYPQQGFLILRREQAEIHFWQTQDERRARDLGGESSCYIRVRNIRPFYEDLKNRKAPFRYELECKPWGMN